MARSAFKRATQAQAAKQWTVAITQYQVWLRQHPHDCAAWLNLSHCALAVADLHTAQHACESAMRQAQTSTLRAEAAYAAGRLARQRHQPSTAQTAFEQALTWQPAFVEAWIGLANLACERKDYPAALDALENALHHQPDSASAWNNLGHVLKQIGEFTAAIRCYEQALHYQPHYPAAWSNLGNARKACRDFLGAIQAHQTALAQDPKHAEAWCNLGVLYYERGEIDQAFAAYERAYALNPHMPYLRWNRAQALLSRGDFHQGWAAYECRWAEKINDPLPDFACPFWQGEALFGKRLLLHTEQGLGDTLQFLRYVPQLLAQGAHLVLHLRTQSGLRRLCQESFPQLLACVVDGETYPPCDFHCPLLSLPHVCQTTASTIPLPIPYLHVPPTRQAQWATRLGEHHEVRIGLVWAGGFRQEIPEAWLHDLRRSLPLAWFNSLAQIPKVAWYSLQQGKPAIQLENGESTLPLARWIEQCDDMAETAALIANLDLVISVDTAVAHLTAALGKPLYLLSRFDACWRWLINGQISPWYPAAHVLRQTQPDDWESVMPLLSTMVSEQAHLRR